MGTGTGVIPRGMAQYGANIIATDISHNQINEAIELSKGMENIKYKVIAAEDIDYEENTFDAITACQCFWYFDSKIVVPKIKKDFKTWWDFFESLYELYEGRGYYSRFK